MKLTNVFSLLVLLSGTLSSCYFHSSTPVPVLTETQNQQSIEPVFINHEMPNLNSNFSPFVAVKCLLDDTEYAWCNISDVSTSENVWCNDIFAPTQLGGLSPADPIAICFVYLDWTDQSWTPEDPVYSSCVYWKYGLFVYCYRYVVYQNGSYKLIKNKDEFRTYFAPVDSANEALGFVLANGDYEAKYGLKKISGNEYLVQEIEDTYVQTTIDGYLVHVFYEDHCSTFSVYAVEFNVSREGQIAEVERHVVYYDPGIGYMCD